MGGTEQEKVRKLILQEFSELDNNLEVILAVGSISSGEFNEFSDIDLILSFRELDYETRAHTARIVAKIESVTKRKVGANIVKTEEIIRPLEPLTILDGKTFQALIEAKVNKNIILYDPTSIYKSFYNPTSEEIKRHSINNVEFFKLRERKLSTHEYDKKEQLSSVLERKMRASFIVSKLAIQATAHQTITNKMDIINAINKHLPSLSGKNLVLIKNLEYKKGVATMKNVELLAENDKYIEELASHVIKLQN